MTRQALHIAIVGYGTAGQAAAVLLIEHVTSLRFIAYSSQSEGEQAKHDSADRTMGSIGAGLG